VIARIAPRVVPNRRRGHDEYSLFQRGALLNFVRSELSLLVAAASVVAIYVVGDRWFSDIAHPLVLAALFTWVFGVILWATFGAVRHADGLAELLGEPYGTLILTIAATCIEISVMAAIMLHANLYPSCRATR